MTEHHHTHDAGSEQSGGTWMRGLYMLAFIILFELAKTVLSLIAVLQFLWLLFTGHRNEAVKDFGASLSIWMGDVARFQACDTDAKPFPWDRWPPSE